MTTDGEIVKVGDETQKAVVVVDKGQSLVHFPRKLGGHSTALGGAHPGQFPLQLTVALRESDGQKKDSGNDTCRARSRCMASC